MYGTVGIVCHLGRAFHGLFCDCDQQSSVRRETGEKASGDRWSLVWRGGAQALMPLLGYVLGTGFRFWIEQIDHWISFALLCIIGFSMIRESRKQCKPMNNSFSAKVMLPLAIANSIDALAAGITFAFLEVSILPAVLLIGSITFLLSAMGVWLGNRFGEKYRSKAELAGGIILVIMGIKILLEHLGILGM